MRMSESVTPEDAVRVTGAQEVGVNAWQARCPVCPDHNQNLRIGKGVGDGKLLMRCAARCTFLDIIYCIKQMRLKQESSELCQPQHR